LSIKQRRVIVNIGYFYREGTHPLQAWFTLIGGFNGDRNKFTVISFTIEYFVGGYLTGFFVHSEFGALLIGLLDNGIFDLRIEGEI
jgi:hypothetical protein